ncbi:hypothetical protein [Streptomyces gardneri]|nr:hypothetical protein [Streptomyces gardneri]
MRLKGPTTNRVRRHDAETPALAEAIWPLPRFLSRRVDADI